MGGRLLKFDDGGTVTYVSPVLEGLCGLKPGDKASPGQVKTVAEILTQALEMAAGLREETPLLEQLTTREAGRFDPCREKELVISFSGGVADCIEKELPWLEFGDIGPILGQTIRESRLCGGEFTLGSETIRATVIGAGCHSAQLSGSTVFHQNVPFPLKNVPVVSLTDISREAIRRELSKQEDSAILAFPGMNSPGYREVAAMAEEIAAGTDGKALICLGTGHGQGAGTGAGASSRPQRGNPVHRPGEGERRQLSGRGRPGGASPTGGGKDSGSRKIEGRGI